MSSLVRHKDQFNGNRTVAVARHAAQHPKRFRANWIARGSDSGKTAATTLTNPALRRRAVR